MSDMIRIPKKAMCKCGHKQYEHEIYPNEHCYKCECKQFKKSRLTPNNVSKG